MDDSIEVIPIAGFDPEGEPEIQVMADGSLSIVFELMPPSWAEDDPDLFDDFDEQLSDAIGLPVVWEDREVFVIERPANETIEKVKRFLLKRRR